MLELTLELLLARDRPPEDLAWMLAIAAEPCSRRTHFSFPLASLLLDFIVNRSKSTVPVCQAARQSPKSVAEFPAKFFRLKLRQTGPGTSPVRESVSVCFCGWCRVWGISGMNVVQEIQRINKKEAELGIAADSGASWHSTWKKSAWVFAGNLPYELTEGDVLTVFSQVGEIEKLDMCRDPDSGEFRGFCFIKYEDQRSTILAVDNFTGASVLGRVIRVDHKFYKPPRRKKEGEEEDEEAAAAKEAEYLKTIDVSWDNMEYRKIAGLDKKAVRPPKKLQKSSTKTLDELDRREAKKDEKRRRRDEKAERKRRKLEKRSRREAASNERSPSPRSPLRKRSVGREEGREPSREAHTAVPSSSERAVNAPELQRQEGDIAPEGPTTLAERRESGSPRGRWSRSRSRSPRGGHSKGNSPRRRWSRSRSRSPRRRRSRSRSPRDRYRSRDSRSRSPRDWRNDDRRRHYDDRGRGYEERRRSHRDEERRRHGDDRRSYRSHHDDRSRDRSRPY